MIYDGVQRSARGARKANAKKAMCSALTNGLEAINQYFYTWLTQPKPSKAWLALLLCVEDVDTYQKFRTPRCVKIQHIHRDLQHACKLALINGTDAEKVDLICQLCDLWRNDPVQFQSAHALLDLATDHKRKVWPYEVQWSAQQLELSKWKVSSNPVALLGIDYGILEHLLAMDQTRIHLKELSYAEVQTPETGSISNSQDPEE